MTSSDTLSALPSIDNLLELLAPLVSIRGDHLELIGGKVKRQRYRPGLGWTILYSINILDWAKGSSCELLL